MTPVTISLTLEGRMAAAIQQRAKTMGKTMSHYVRLLVDGAYAARIAGERDGTSGDAELDRQVKQVFLLADCEPEFIAQALGMEQGRVERILEGWKTVAGEKPRAALPLPDASRGVSPPDGGGPSGGASNDRRPPVGGSASPSAVTGGGTAVDGGRKNAWSPEHVEIVRRMWADGQSVKAIAAAVGRDHWAVQKWAETHRDVCPARTISARGWSEEHVEIAREMWAAGETATTIGAAVGRQATAVQQWASKNRDVCPRRLA